MIEKLPLQLKKFVDTTPNATVECHTVWRKNKGYAEYWTLSQEGPDSYSITVLGVGDTLDEAIKSWKQHITPKGRRGT